MSYDGNYWDNPPHRKHDPHCKHGCIGYCFDCVRERHNQEVLDGKYDDIDDDYASTPHPRAYYDEDHQ